MSKMKEFRDKFNTMKDKFKPDKSDDQSLKLCYDTNTTLGNIAVTKDFCTEMRKIGSYGLVTYSINDDDKKTKKKSLNTLTQLFSESSSKLNEEDPMRGPLNLSALVLAKINGITKEFEKSLHNQVIGPLAEIETNCNEIQELRKKLHDLRRDLVNLNDKLGRFLDQSNADEQKTHALQEQIDEAEMEFENVSDTYVLKVLLFETANFEHAQAIHDMVILRTEYHDKCAKELLKIIPEANQFMEDKRVFYSFRYPLENHLREIKKGIAYPIEKCVTALSNIEDLRQEGLFRVSGGRSKSNLLCSALNIMKFDHINCKWSPHVLADVLKRYLREMPTRLLGKVGSSDWDSCYEKFKSGNKQDAYWQIKDLLNKMPKSYYNNLEYLIRFLTKVVQEKSYNLMTVQNICTVFTPNLFTQSNDVAGSVGMNMELNASCNFVLESLLNETHFFFPHSNQDMASSMSQHAPLPSPPAIPSIFVPISQSLIPLTLSPNVISSPPVLRSPPSLPSLPESKKPSSLQIIIKNQKLEVNQILYRAQSENSPDSSNERSFNDTRLHRRRQRFIGSNIFITDDSTSPTKADQGSTIFHFSSIESKNPIPPPRRNQKYPSK